MAYFTKQCFTLLFDSGAFIYLNMQKLTLLPYINEYLHSKNPESIVLGKKIVQQSIVLVDSRGFETFKFKKLGDKIGSNENFNLSIF